MATSELQQTLLNMKVPVKRIDDLGWLDRNLRFFQTNSLFEKAKALVQEEAKMKGFDLKWLT
jgi:hypothetical protein